MSSISGIKIDDSVISQSENVQFESSKSKNFDEIQNVTDLTLIPKDPSTESVQRAFGSAMSEEIARSNVDSSQHAIDALENRINQFSISEDKSHKKIEEAVRPAIRKSFSEDPLFDLNILQIIELYAPGSSIEMLRSGCLFRVLDDENIPTEQFDLFISLQSKEEFNRFFLDLTESKDTILVQAITKLKRFQEISLDNLNMAFVKSAELGFVYNFRALVACSRFEEVSIDALEKAFIAAAKFSKPVQNTGMMNLVESVIIQMTCDAENKDLSEKMLGALIESSGFAKISKDVLNQVFSFAIENKRIKHLKAIVDSNRFKEISHQNLEEAFRLAADLKIAFNSGDSCESEAEGIKISKKNKDIFLKLQMEEKDGLENLNISLITSQRFKEISKDSLEFIFFCAVKKGLPKTLEALVGSNRFQEISNKAFEDAVKYAQESKDESISKILARIKSQKEQQTS